MGEFLRRPVPCKKYEELRDSIGLRILSKCTNVGRFSLELFFLRNGRILHKSRAVRFKFLDKVASLLKGAYNKRGIRRWFYRKRTALGNKSAIEMLAGEWNPSESGPQKVLALAKSLRGGNAT